MPAGQTMIPNGLMCRALQMHQKALAISIMSMFKKMTKSEPRRNMGRALMSNETKIKVEARLTKFFLKLMKWRRFFLHQRLKVLLERMTT